MFRHMGWLLSRCRTAESLHPSYAAGRAGDTGPSGRRSDPLGGRHGLELAAELLDLVPQLGRVLEAELLGGHVHLLLERDDELLQLLRAHALDLALATTAARGDVRLLQSQELGDVGNALDDRLRRDAVLLVVRE